jgi:ABC-2 type transport system permease protein
VRETVEFRPYLRVIRAGWVFSLKSLTTSSFFLLTSLFQPVIFATISFFMFEAGGRSESLLYVALGAGIMGIWSSTLFGSGGMIQWERWQGTLEILVAAPTPLVLVVVPATLATSTIGIYSLTATIAWGKLFFDIPLDLSQPVMFFVAIAATILGLGLMGLLLASTFILYRNANAMSNLLEYPVWLVTGLLVPIALLPAWAGWISWLLAPTWGIKAIRAAALGGDPWGPILMTLGLGVAYMAIGTRFLQYFERRARESATLSLT